MANGKKYDCFDNFDDALFLFNRMVEMYPRPSIVEFTKLLGAIVRMKHFALVISLCNQIELLGVGHDAFTITS